MRAPIPADEQRRLALLAEWEVLDTPPEIVFDDLTRLAAGISGCPIALVSLVDRERQWFKARVGLDVTETSRDASFCAHALLQPRDILVIEDATRDPRTSDNPLVLGEPGIRFYAGAPLLVEDSGLAGQAMASGGAADSDPGTSPGTAIGTLCIIDTKPRKLTDEQLRQLRLLARLVVTELRLRHANRELVQAHASATAANRAKSEFLAAMSHEIRTPLTSLVGYSDLLIRQSLPEVDRLEAIETIHRAGTHLRGLINDILDFSQIESGELRLRPADVDVAHEIEEAVRVARQATVRPQPLPIRTDLSALAGVTARIDPVRLRQIVVNLVSNAIKFTEAGSVAVAARLEPGPHHHRLSIEVIDTGIGMGPDVLARLFTPFTQADQSPKRKYGGTGLGLSISRKIAELMGGTLEVASTPGRGSTFTLSVPLNVLSRPGDDNTTPAGTPSTNSSSSGTAQARTAQTTPGQTTTGQVPPLPDPTSACGGDDRPRVLLAEDGKDNQRLFVAFLKAHVRDLVLVTDGAQVLQRLRDDADFDLVLMDMHMPYVDGLEATRRLRAEGFTLPVLALTASATTDDRYRAIEAGCDDFLTKPILRDQLVHAVRRWTSRVPGSLDTGPGNPLTRTA